MALSYIALISAALALLRPAAAAAIVATAILIPAAWYTIAAPRRWVFMFLAAAILLPPLPLAWGDSVWQLPAPAGFSAQFLWLDSGVFRRAQGLFYEASTLGNFCACFLVMCAVALTEPRGKRLLPTWLLIAGAVLFGATTVLSF